MKRGSASCVFVILKRWLYRIKNVKKMTTEQEFAMRLELLKISISIVGANNLPEILKIYDTLYSKVFLNAEYVGKYSN
jgi:O-antigen/teichoic acid export membrane protein